MEHYFIKYEGIKTEAGYMIPGSLKDELESIEGFELIHNGQYQPILIATFPEERIEDIESLEGIIQVAEREDLDLLK